MDLTLLERALDNPNNATLANLDIELVKSNKNNILQQLNLDREKLKKYNKMLKGYLYIDNVSVLKIGSMVRWIDILDLDNIKLRQGGLLCDIINSNENILFRVKLFNNRIITINYTNCLIFQLFTHQEKIILKAFELVKKK